MGLKMVLCGKRGCWATPRKESIQNLGFRIIHTEFRLHHSILPSQSSGLPTFCFEDIFHLSVKFSWSTRHRIGCEQQQIHQVEKSQGLSKAWKHKYFARPFGSESHETSSFHCLLSQNLAQSSLWLVGWGRKIIISPGYIDSVLR